MKVIVKDDACIGCGQCCATCEEVFEFNSDKGLAEVKEDASFEEYADEIEEAKNGCPTEAIEVE